MNTFEQYCGKKNDNSAVHSSIQACNIEIRYFFSLSFPVRHDENELWQHHISLRTAQQLFVCGPWSWTGRQTLLKLN